jgi:hypothetical protein
MGSGTLWSRYERMTVCDGLCILWPDKGMSSERRPGTNSSMNVNF